MKKSKSKKFNELTLLRDIIVEEKKLLKQSKHKIKVLVFGEIGEWNEDGGERYFAALCQFQDGSIYSIYLDYEGTIKKLNN